MRRARFLLLLILGIGCSPTFAPGDCDLDRARRLVYSDQGTPAFRGQALMIQSCANGSACHSEGASALQRYAAPADMNYDLIPLTDADPSDESVTAHIAQLVRSLASARRDRDQIWTSVQLNRMPIASMPSAVLGELAPSFHRFDALENRFVAVSRLDASDARDEFRNWLACDLPIVTATTSLSGFDLPASPPEGCPTDGCVSEIEDLGLEASPRYPWVPDPTWASIYEVVIARRCSSAPCHGASAAGDLQMNDIDQAFDALVGRTAQSDECRGMGTLVVPGNAVESILYRKMAELDVCGHRSAIGSSPLPAPVVDAIATWIDAGARRN